MSKNTTAKVLHKSKVDSPVARVHRFVIANHKKLGRSGCVDKLVAMGIAFYTARTQYQRVHANGYKLPGAKPAAKTTKRAKAKRPTKPVTPVASVAEAKAA